MDDGIVSPHRLPRLQPEIVDDPIALVEQADDRDPILHRGQPGLIAFQHLAGVRLLQLLLVGALLLTARGQRDRERDWNAGFPEHSYSGVQGW